MHRERIEQPHRGTRGGLAPLAFGGDQLAADAREFAEFMDGLAAEARTASSSRDEWVKR